MPPSTDPPITRITGFAPSGPAGSVSGDAVRDLIVNIDDFVDQAGRVTLGGTTFDQSWYSGHCSCVSYIDLELGRDYSRVQAALGIDDSAQWGSKVSYKITADQLEPITGTLAVGQVVPIDLPVTDVLRLRFEFTVTEGLASTALGNLTLLPND